MTWKFKQVVCCLLCANKYPVGERPLQSADCTHQWAWPGAVFGCFLLAQGQKWISPRSRLSAWAPHRMVPLESCRKVLCWPNPVETALLADHLHSSCTQHEPGLSGTGWVSPSHGLGVTQSWVHLLCFPLSLSKMALGSLKHP